MQDIIKIGVPSKGRLRKDVLKIFKTSLRSLPLLGIPILIKSFINYKLKAAPTAGTCFLEPRSEINRS